MELINRIASEQKKKNKDLYKKMYISWLVSDITPNKNNILYQLF